MLRQSLNGFTQRLFVATNQCRLLSSSSQIIVKQTSDESVAKPDGRSANEMMDPTANRQQSHGLSDYERQELAKIVKSPVQMDAYWETHLNEKKPVVKNWRDYKGGLSVDFIHFMSQKFDFSLQGIKRRIRVYIGLREVYNQRYINRRHAILGPELATAHFVVYRGGQVRFKHIPKTWINVCEQMPNVYDDKYRLTHVNASNLKLRYEAFDNFILLDSLQELNLSKNKLLDDFVCDKIGRQFRNSKTLQVLDLSDNPLITHRGIETLHRIKSLRKLIITGTKAAKYPFIDLLVILFTDVNPNCEIVI